MNKVFVKRGLKDFIDLGEIEIKTGPFGTQLHASDYVEKGTAVINVRNIGYGRIKTDKLEYINEETVQRLSSHLLKQNDIVFGRKGAVDRHALIMPNQQGWFQGSDCLRIRIKSESLDPLFLSYCFLTDNHKKWMMAQCSHGATMASLNQDIISRIPVSIPNIQIQQKIASILSNYDDLIENNTLRIEILEQMAKLVYEEWFVKFRFPGHEKVKMVSSELGEIPEGWKAEKLGDVCHIVMGQSPKSEFYNETGEGLPFHQGVTNFGDRFPTDKVYCTILNRIAEKGDILFSVRAPVGRINIANKKIVIGRGLCSIRSKTGNQTFMFQQLKNKFQIEDSMGGGTIFKSVTKNDMNEIKVIFPLFSLISKFEVTVQPIFQSLEILNLKNQNLRKTRDLLLPKLISGEIDVSDLDISIKNEFQEA